MDSPIRIAASILAADFTALGAAVEAADSGGAGWIHLDVMDGHFVPNLSFGPPVIQALRARSRLPFDVHLMVERPENLIPDCCAAGADLITVHAEVSPHLHRTLAWLKELGVRAGVCLNPATPLGVLEEVMEEVDLVVLMSVNPGFGGQEFIPRVLEKIRRCRSMLDAAGSAAELSVDGGVGPQNAAQVAAAGASVLVSGSAVFGHPGGVARGLSDLRAVLPG